MSDTPRTDALEAEMQKLSYSAPNNYCIELCQQLERELNAAKIREKELEGNSIIAEVAVQRLTEKSGVLAVGEPCAGVWIGPPDASLRQWSCRCGANNPQQCRTETAKKD